MQETTDAALVSCQAEKGELRMLVGCYYRCPIVIEEGDKDHPRFYVLAQLDEYNEIADAIKVKMDGQETKADSKIRQLTFGLSGAL